MKFSAITFLAAMMLSMPAFSAGAENGFFSAFAGHDRFHNCNVGCGLDLESDDVFVGGSFGAQGSGSVFAFGEAMISTGALMFVPGAGVRSGHWEARLGYGMGWHQARISDSISGFRRDNRDSRVELPMVEVSYRGVFLRYGSGDASFQRDYRSVVDDSTVITRTRRESYDQISLGYRWRFAFH